MSDADANRRFTLLVTLGGLAFGALASLLMGQDMNGDLLNYHFYNAFAFFHDRTALDFLPAQGMDWTNPVADIPFYLTATHWPAWIFGALNGALHGLVLPLLYLTARKILPIEDATLARLAALTLAFAGFMGEGFFSSLGGTMNDQLVCLGVLVSLLFGFNNKPFLSGLAIGITTGLKLTAAPYAMGLGGAFMLMPGTLKTRSRILFVFGLGSILGHLPLNGWWMAKLWQETGNPLFPYFNNIFHSPLLPPVDYHYDLYTQNRSLFKTIFFPFFFTFDWRLVSPKSFFDPRLLMAFVFGGFGGLYVFGRKVFCSFIHTIQTLSFVIPAKAGIHEHTPGSSPVTHNAMDSRLRGNDMAAAFLLIFAATSYIVWLLLFSVYRYAMPLEVLSPLIIAVGICFLVKDKTAAVLSTAAVLALVISTTRYNPWGREPFQSRAMKAAVPSFQNPAQTMVFLAGNNGASWLIPRFQDGVQFVRLGAGQTAPWLGHGEGELETERVRRIVPHNGPFYILFNAVDANEADAALAREGFKNTGACRKIKPPAWRSFYKLCAVEKTGSAP